MIRWQNTCATSGDLVADIRAKEGWLAFAEERQRLIASITRPIPTPLVVDGRKVVIASIGVTSVREEGWINRRPVEALAHVEWIEWREPREIAVPFAARWHGGTVKAFDAEGREIPCVDVTAEVLRAAAREAKEST